MMKDQPHVIACHYNHRWCPEEDEHAEYVKGVCTEAGITLHLGVNNTGDKTETGSRKLRYDFFEQVCREVGAYRILLAHHLDDQVETILFRIARGTGVDGLSGIPASRQLYPGCVVERPLMHLTKDQILAYCEENEVEWRLDPTNADTSKCRGLIRHTILPELLKTNPQAKQAIARLGKLAEQDSQLIEMFLADKINTLDLRVGDSEWSIDYSAFMRLDVLVRNRIWTKLDKGPLTAKRLDIVNESLITRTKRMLKGAWTIEHIDGRIVMQQTTEKAL